MTKKLAIGIAVGVIAVVLLFLLTRQSKPQASFQVTASTTPSQSPQPQQTGSTSSPMPSQMPPTAIRQMGEREREREKKIWDTGLATPIQFYGKVEDEKGNPVEAARVHISMHDRLGGGGADTEQKTDKDGLFSASGHGLGLGVVVFKDGYYQLPQSYGSFGYAQGAGNGAPHPDPSTPAIFILRKMGKTEPLIVVRHNYPIAKNGTPVEINLATGKAVQASQSEIKVEAWTNDQGHQVNSNRPYDWRCRITVPGGGLVQRAGEFDFDAPSDGYADSDEIDMPANLGQQWRTQDSRNYFVRLANGMYARLEFRMIAGGDHFFKITSYLNPQPGSRNLEYGQPQPGTAP